VALAARVWWVQVFGVTARALEPSKTVGVAKSLGAHRLNCEKPTQMAIPLQMERVSLNSWSLQ